MSTFKLVRLNEDYHKFLMGIDPIVLKKNNRPLIGFLVNFNGIDYAIPITSKTYRENGKRRNQRTTIEIIKSNHDYGALLFNNMVPIVPDLVSEINIDCESPSEQILLNIKNSFIRKHSDVIINKALSVYKLVVEEEDAFIIKFCCRFTYLEEKLIEYCELNSLDVPIQRSTYSEVIITTENEEHVR